MNSADQLLQYLSTPLPRNYIISIRTRRVANTTVKMLRKKLKKTKRNLSLAIKDEENKPIIPIYIMRLRAAELELKAWKAIIFKAREDAQ